MLYFVSLKECYKRVGAVVGCAGVLGCGAVSPKTTFQKSDLDRSHSSEQEAVAQELDVVDHLGRWSTRLTLPYQVSSVARRSSSSDELVEQDVLPGYVHVTMKPPGQPSANCFVYETSIFAGEATDKLLRAIAPGLEFDAFSPLRISVENGEPLVETGVRYTATQPPYSSGQIQFLIHPRADFPIVCSTEVTGKHALDSSLMRQFVRQFEVRKKLYRPILRELWVLHDEKVPRGFRHLAVNSVEEGESLTVTTSAWFELSSKGAANVDRVVRESKIDGLLRWAQWFDLFDGRVVYRGQIERNEQDVGYAFGVEFESDAHTGTFLSSPLPSLSTFSGLAQPDLAGALKQDDDGRLTLFDPYLTPAGSTSCKVHVPSSQAKRPGLCLSCSPASDSNQSFPFRFRPTATFHLLDGQGRELTEFESSSCQTSKAVAEEPSEVGLISNHLGHQARLIYREGALPSSAHKDLDAHE